MSDYTSQLLKPVCLNERNHDVLTEQDCVFCAIERALFSIALDSTDEIARDLAKEVLDESVEWTPIK